jgi:transposase
MFTMSKAERDTKRKLGVFRYAEKVGDISKACRHFGISRQIFYDWKHRYERDGEKGLIDYKPCPENPSVKY